MPIKKILVDKETGIIGDVLIYDLDAHRPEPLDQAYIEIEADNPIYKHCVLGEHTNISFGRSKYNFQTQEFEWVYAKVLTVPDMIPARNFNLARSDYVFADLQTQEEIDAWIEYRQKLRDLPVTLKGKTGEDVKLPRDPKEIAQLKIEAAKGDLDAQRNIEEEGL
jgi:hypothetical protein